MSETNRFRGTCYRCGGLVPAGNGILTHENVPGSRWPEARFQTNWVLIEHPYCQTRFAGTDVHYKWNPHHESA